MVACDKVCQLPAQCRWFSQGTPASFTSKTDHHDMTEILLKVALHPNQTSKQTSTTEVSTLLPDLQCTCSCIKF